MRTTGKVKPQLLFPQRWVLKRPRGLNERPVSAKWGHPRAVARKQEDAAGKIPAALPGTLP